MLRRSPVSPEGIAVQSQQRRRLIGCGIAPDASCLHQRADIDDDRSRTGRAVFIPRRAPSSLETLEMRLSRRISSRTFAEVGQFVQVVGGRRPVRSRIAFLPEGADCADSPASGRC